jgi:hypothetical protein
MTQYAYVAIVIVVLLAIGIAMWALRRRGRYEVDSEPITHDSTPIGAGGVAAPMHADGIMGTVAGESSMVGGSSYRPTAPYGQSSGRPTNILSGKGAGNGQLYAWLTRADTSERMPIRETALRIGRHEDNDLRLDDDSVHRRHAIVHMTPQREFVITDLSGSGGNHVFVNGQQVEERSLQDGDEIRLGKIRLRFQVVQMEDGRIVPRTAGTPQGGVVATVERGPEAPETQDFVEALAKKKPRTREFVSNLQCSVLSPTKVRPGAQFILHVYLHSAQDIQRVIEEADRAEPGTAVKVSDGTTTHVVKPLPLPIAPETKVDVFIELDGLLARRMTETHFSIVWRGTADGFQTVLGVPVVSFRRTYYPIVRMCINGTFVSKVVLKIRRRLFSTSRAQTSKMVLASYRKAFLSYSSTDRQEVLKRAQALQAARIQVLQDVLSLQPGDRWSERIMAWIEECDVFVLFWSKAASKSPEVLKEAKHALKCSKRSRRRTPEIVPVVLEGPPSPIPPAWLSHIHFNDPICYFLGTGAGAVRSL